MNALALFLILTIPVSEILRVPTISHKLQPTSLTSGPSVIPDTFNFGTVFKGKDSCTTFAFENYWFGSDSVFITDIKFLHRDKHFSISPPFTKKIAVPFTANYNFSVCYSSDSSLEEVFDTLLLFNGNYVFRNPVRAGPQSKCLITEHELSYRDPVAIGASAEHQFRLINESGVPITISSVTLDDTLQSEFKITSSLPITIPPLTNDRFLTYTFTPRSDNNGTFFTSNFATINIEGEKIPCTTLKALLIGNISKTDGGADLDTSIQGLYSTETGVLIIEGTQKTITKQFTFRNNLSVPVTISKVYIKNRTYFQMTAIDPPLSTITLNPNQEMKISIAFTAPENSKFTDTLFIDESYNLQTSIFTLEGRRYSSGVTPLLPPGVSVNILPNPASNNSYVKMVGVKSAHIQVSDLLGRELASANENELWKWDAVAEPQGSYIIRIDGISIGGEHFTYSKNVIIHR
jgi:hypothetical protein